MDNNDRIISNDVIECSYYMIYLFQEKGKEITNLKLQKLMYFTEAYYMALANNEEELYTTDWIAWNYGPVSIELYEKYKDFKSLSIILSDDEINIANNIPNINKLVIDIIFEVFGNLDSYTLVNLTHSNGSPWEKISKNCDGMLDNLDNNEKKLDKKMTFIWFKNKFSRLFGSNE